MPNYNGLIGMDVSAGVGGSPAQAQESTSLLGASANVSVGKPSGGNAHYGLVGILLVSAFIIVGIHFAGIRSHYTLSIGE